MPRKGKQPKETRGRRAKGTLKGIEFEGHEFMPVPRKNHSFHTTNVAYAHALDWASLFHEEFRGNKSKLIKRAIYEYIQNHSDEFKKPFPKEILERMEEE